VISPVVGRLAADGRRQSAMHELVSEPLRPAVGALTPERPAELQHVLVANAGGAAEALDDRAGARPLANLHGVTRAHDEPAADRVPGREARPREKRALHVRGSDAPQRARGDGGVEGGKETFEPRPTLRTPAPSASSRDEVFLPHGLRVTAGTTARPSGPRRAAALVVGAVPHEVPPSDLIANVHGAHRTAPRRSAARGWPRTRLRPLERCSGPRGGARAASAAAAPILGKPARPRWIQPADGQLEKV